MRIDDEHIEATKRVTVKVSNRRWKIRNRFVGFIALLPYIKDFEISNQRGKKIFQGNRVWPQFGRGQEMMTLGKFHLDEVWQRHTHIQKGKEKDLIEFALAGLSAFPALNIVIGCKDKDELMRYSAMLTDVRSDMKLRYSCDGFCRLVTGSEMQSVELVLVSESERESLAGYCRHYLWFMGMHDTFSLDAFSIMRGNLIEEHNAIITFGYAADRVVDVEAIG